MTEPSPGQRLDTGLANLKTLTTAYGAIGWFVQGKAQKAQASLNVLNAGQLRVLSAAAFGLASLADHLANEKEKETPTDG